MKFQYFLSFHKTTENREKVLTTMLHIPTAINSYFRNGIFNFQICLAQISEKRYKQELTDFPLFDEVLL